MMCNTANKSVVAVTNLGNHGGSGTGCAVFVECNCQFKILLLMPKFLVVKSIGGYGAVVINPSQSPKNPNEA